MDFSSSNMGSVTVTKHQTHNDTKVHFSLSSSKLKCWWKFCEEISLCFGKKKPWSQSDFIINSSVIIGKVIHSEVTFRNWISNWQTRKIFLISWTISLWFMHYRGTVTSLITQNNVRAIPGTTPLAMRCKLIPPSLSFICDLTSAK